MCVFKWELRNTDGIKNRDITRIHDDEVNKIAEYDLLHDIINPPKTIKF